MPASGGTGDEIGAILRWLPRIAVAWLIAAISAGPAWAGPPPASAFVQSPQFRSAALSPDGETLAVDRVTDEGTKVVVFRVGSTTPLRIVRVDENDTLRGLTWADEETLLIDVSGTVRIDGLPAVRGTMEYWRTLAVGIDDDPPRMLLMDQPERQYVAGAEIVAVRPNQPGTVYMASWDYTRARRTQSIGTRLSNERRDSGWVSTLFEVDTRSGRGKPIEQGTAYTLSWLVDEQGSPLARSEWNPETSEFTVLANSGRSWKTVVRAVNQDRFALAGLTADRKALVLIGENGTDRVRAWAVPRDGSGSMTLFFEDDDGDISGVMRDPETSVVRGFLTGGLSSRLRWLDSSIERQQTMLERTYPGRQVTMTDRSADGQRVLVRVEAPTHPPVYYLVDFAAKKADLVGEVYPELGGAALGEVGTVTIMARDGLKIPAYLTRPATPGTGTRPAVILPHGGPEARDHGGFDWWAQFLATRGYIVLQPQFRGSTGFGREFRLAGYGEWGGRMQDDLTDSVGYLVDSGLADPNRIAIVGGSYGGYAALAGATLTPELYACAVSVNGVSDLPRMIGDESRRGGEQSNAIAYWRRHIGSASSPLLAERSPARRAADVRAPILLLHGEDDTVVPISQSEAMARALDNAGKPHRFVSLPGEDHWLSSGPTRTRVLEEIEQFLAECMSVPADDRDSPAHGATAH